GPATDEDQREAGPDQRYDQRLEEGHRDQAPEGAAVDDPHLPEAHHGGCASEGDGAVDDQLHHLGEREPQSLRRGGFHDTPRSRIEPPGAFSAAQTADNPTSPMTR